MNILLQEAIYQNDLGKYQSGEINFMAIGVFAHYSQQNHHKKKQRREWKKKTNGTRT